MVLYMYELHLSSMPLIRYVSDFIGKDQFEKVYAIRALF